MLKSFTLLGGNHQMSWLMTTFAALLRLFFTRTAGVLRCQTNRTWQVNWEDSFVLLNALPHYLRIMNGGGGEDVADYGPFDGKWGDVTCNILSPGWRAEAAGPSCCTLVTKIPYKSKWYTVRTTQGHDGLESLPLSCLSWYPTPAPQK